jgi:hypothetical protein
MKNHSRKVFEYIRLAKTCSFKAFVEWRTVSIKKIMMENRVSFYKPFLLLILLKYNRDANIDLIIQLIIIFLYPK